MHRLSIMKNARRMLLSVNRTNSENVFVWLAECSGGLCWLGRGSPCAWPQTTLYLTRYSRSASRQARLSVWKAANCGFMPAPCVVPGMQTYSSSLPASLPRAHNISENSLSLSDAIHPISGLQRRCCGVIPESRGPACGLGVEEVELRTPEDHRWQLDSRVRLSSLPL